MTDSNEKPEAIKVNDDDLIKAVTEIMDFCQERGMTELVAYMAMIEITCAMEEELGFGYKRRTQS